MLFTLQQMGIAGPETRLNVNYFYIIYYMFLDSEGYVYEKLCHHHLWQRSQEHFAAHNLCFAIKVSLICGAGPNIGQGERRKANQIRHPCSMQHAGLSVVSDRHAHLDS